MKKINLKNNPLLMVVSICFLSVSLLTVSCTDAKAEDTLENKVNDEEKINELFSLIDSKLEQRIQTLRHENNDKVVQKAITFLVIKDNNSGKIGLANFKEESFFPIFPLSFEDNASNSNSGGGYVVSCTGGSKGDWEKKCSGKFSCGKAIAKSLDQGGCARICEAPKEKEYLRLTRKKDLELTDLTDISVVEISRIP